MLKYYLLCSLRHFGTVICNHCFLFFYMQEEQPSQPATPVTPPPAEPKPQPVSTPSPKVSLVLNVRQNITFVLPDLSFKQILYG